VAGGFKALIAIAFAQPHEAQTRAEAGCLGALEQRTGLRNAPRTTQAEYVPTKR
jgi:hypothetical protein